MIVILKMLHSNKECLYFLTFSITDSGIKLMNSLEI